MQSIARATLERRCLYCHVFNVHFLPKLLLLPQLIDWCWGLPRDVVDDVRRGLCTVVFATPGSSWNPAPGELGRTHGFLQAATACPTNVDKRYLWSMTPRFGIGRPTGSKTIQCCTGSTAVKCATGVGLSG
jgi:hypothetical protein